jgi:hypothetical protein
LAYFGWQRFGPAQAETTPTLGPDSPWSLAPEQVDTIRLTDPGGAAVVVLQRDPDQGWRMRAPAMGEADAGRIEAALTAVLAPVVAQAMESPEELEPFGLRPPQIRLTLLLADGTALSMDVGAIDPTGSVYYTQVQGDGRLLMISRFSLEDLLGLLGAPPFPLPTGTPLPTEIGTGTP